MLQMRDDRDEDLERDGASKTRRVELGDKNFEEWHEFYKTKSLVSNDLAHYVATGELPACVNATLKSSRKPRKGKKARGRSQPSLAPGKSAGGGGEREDEKVEIAGSDEEEDEMELWETQRRAYEIEYKESLQDKKVFLGVRSRFMVQVIESISRKVLEKMKLSPRYQKIERDNDLPGLFDLAKTTTKGYGTSTLYMEFLRINELREDESKWSTGFTEFREARRAIRTRLASKEYTAEELIERWMDTIFVMACRKVPLLETQIKLIMGSEHWPTGDDALAKFEQYLSLNERFDGDKGDQKNGAVMANAAKVGKKSSGKVSAGGGGKIRRHDCFKCGEGGHRMNQCAAPVPECGVKGCGGPHVTKMHDEAEKLNERIRENHNDPDSYCDAERKKCMERMGREARAYRGEVEMSDEEYFEDYIHYYANAPMRAMAGRAESSGSGTVTAGASNLEEEDPWPFDEQADFEICVDSDDDGDVSASVRALRAYVQPSDEEWGRMHPTKKEPPTTSWIKWISNLATGDAEPNKKER